MTAQDSSQSHRPKANGDAPENGSQTDGAEAASLVNQLVKRAHQEGWNPLPSIKFKCIGCQTEVSLDFDDVFKSYHFDHPATEDSGRALHPLASPLTCQRCEAGRFLISVRPTTFKEWLRELVSEVATTECDPAVGFVDADTGERFADSHFTSVSSFDELWSRVAGSVNSKGGINPEYEFNMIGTRVVDRTIRGVAHWNPHNDVRTVIFKDLHGDLWYLLE